MYKIIYLLLISLLIISCVPKPDYARPSFIHKQEKFDHPVDAVITKDKTYHNYKSNKVYSEMNGVDRQAVDHYLMSLNYCQTENWSTKDISIESSQHCKHAMKFYREIYRSGYNWGIAGSYSGNDPWFSLLEGMVDKCTHRDSPAVILYENHDMTFFCGEGGVYRRAGAPKVSQIKTKMHSAGANNQLLNQSNIQSSTKIKTKSITALPYDEEKITGLFVKAIGATMYDHDFPLAKKLYREIMNNTSEGSSEYIRARDEYNYIDVYAAKKKVQDEKNKVILASRERKEKLANERALRNKEIRKREQEKIAVKKRQIIKNNNKRYPLKNLKFHSDSVISFDELQIGKTSKGAAVQIYDTILREKYAKEIVENDVAFVLRQAFSGPRITRSSLLVEQSSLQIHDKVTLQCFKYFGKHSNKTVNDCLYFYKDVLVGGRFNRGNITVDSLANLLPSFPVKENYVSNNVIIRLERSNDQFLLKSLTGGYVTTTKTTRTTALTPVGVTSYQNKNNTVGLICIAPKDLSEMLAEFSKRYSYSCH